MAGMELLTVKQRKLLQMLLAQGDFLRGADAAARLGVTDRTVRTDVAQMDSALAQFGAHIESVRGKGYRLVTDDPAALRSLLYGDGSLVSQEDRMQAILERLVFSEDSISLGDLQDELFVSHTTLENDLRRIRRHHPHLRLRRSENRIELEGNEEERRFLLRLMFTDDWDYNMDAGLWGRDTFLDPEVFDLISREAKRIMHERRLTVNDHGLVSFIFAVTIAYHRITTGHPLGGPCDQPDALARQVVEELCGLLEEKLEMTFSPFERQHLAAYLAQEHLFHLEQAPPGEVEAIVDPAVIAMRDGYLALLRDRYGLDLTDDGRLRSQLAICFQAAKTTRYFGRRSELVCMLRAEDPYIFELAVQAAPLFDAAFGIRLRENELGEVGGYLAAAIERKAIRTRRVPVALASHLSYSNSSYLIARLSAFFGNRMELRGPYSVYDRQALLNSGCPLILTTTKADLIGSTEQQILSISLELPEREIFAIHGALQAQRDAALYGVRETELEGYFAPALFFPHCQASSREALLRLLCDRLFETGAVDAGFYDDVTRREELASTDFEPGFAMPHALCACARRTVIAVAILDKPILWGDTKVGYVCLAAVRPEERSLLFRVYRDLRARFAGRSAWRQLAEVREFDDFLKLLGKNPE